MDASYLTVGIVLIVVGFLLMLVELLLPRGGALAALSIGFIAVGIGFSFFYDVIVGLLSLFGVLFALPIFIGTVAQYWSRSPAGHPYYLPGTAPEDTVAALPHLQDLEHLKGRFGRTLSALRPAGVVDFDGRRVDTLTEGMMVEPDQWVRCIDVRAGKVIVRPAERPNLDDLENAFSG